MTVALGEEVVSHSLEVNPAKPQSLPDLLKEKFWGRWGGVSFSQHLKTLP